MTLFVPRIIGIGFSDSPIKSAGSWINPPPPATASTKPANPAAIIRNIAVSIPI